MRALQNGHWKCGHHAYTFDVTLAFGTRKANRLYFESAAARELIIPKIRRIQSRASPGCSRCLETVRRMKINHFFNIHIILSLNTTKKEYSRRKRYASVAYTKFENKQINKRKQLLKWQIEEKKMSTISKWKSSENTFDHLTSTWIKISNNLHWINLLLINNNNNCM